MKKLLIGTVLFTLHLNFGLVEAKEVKVYNEDSQLQYVIRNNRIYDKDLRWKGTIRQDKIYDEDSKWRGTIRNSSKKSRSRRSAVSEESSDD